MNQSPNNRILSISLSANGIGYAVMEGENSLIAYGNHVVKGDKNKKSLAKVTKHIEFYRPDVLVLQDVMAKDSKRLHRVKRLHSQVIKLAGEHRLKIKAFTKTQMRELLLGKPKGTKHEIAELMAKQFPDELASRLPPKRKFYDTEDPRMDIFEAVALVAALRK